MRVQNWILLIVVLMLLVQINSLLGQTKRLYVDVPEENLRAAPNGRKVGTVLEGTELTQLVENDNWVKVQVTAWIWKPSLTNVARSVEGEYRALHILVKTREAAEEILGQLNAGEDFQELARARSIAPSAAAGGDLGYFSKGDFDPTLENAILNLQVGEISPIVETQFGYNIFKRLK